MKNTNSGFNPLFLMLAFFGVLFIGMIFRPIAFLLFIVLLVGIFVGSIFMIFKYFRDVEEEKVFQNSMEGTIAQNLKRCDAQIGKNKIEMQDIRKNIQDLRDKTERKMGINENTLRESDFLIASFERELDLRQAKLDFYKICKKKIQSIYNNQQLVEELSRKKEKLKQLQEEHFEDLAAMEQLRSDMDYNKTYIDTINNLSLRMAESTSLSGAQEVHDELKQITKELNDL